MLVIYNYFDLMRSFKLKLNIREEAITTLLKASSKRMDLTMNHHI